MTGKRKSGGGLNKSPEKNEIGTANQSLDEGLTMSDDEEGGTRVGDIYIPPPVEPYCSTDVKGNRLIITNIIIENFKSYAGKVELGPFHHCTSAVIGPNGSGKSNVIDSMLFVFGYRAQKLRSKKLSVLIHSSSKAPTYNSCTVYVHFQEIEDLPDAQFKIVPNTEFVISRTAFRDNSSFYSVDERRTNFKEVAKILKQHNVDLQHNRFLILQGEVESIAMMKPKAATPSECGLLEYLEDIVGTARYKEPLQKINERVELLNEERTEKHNRCKLAEREMKDLEQPMEEAVRYLQQENEMTRHKNLQFQKYLYELRKKLKVYEEDMLKFDEELKTHDQGVEEIKQQRIEKEKFIEEESKKHNALIKKRNEFDGLYRNAINKVSELQASLQMTNINRKQNAATLEKEKKNLESLREIPEKNRKTIEDATQRMEQFTNKMDELQKTLEENRIILRAETKDLIKSKDNLQAELVELQRAADDTKAEMNVAETELKMCQLNQTTEYEKLELIKSGISNGEEQLGDASTELKTKEAEIIEMTQRYEQSVVDLRRLESEERTLQAKLQELEGNIEEAQSSFQTNHSNNRVLNALMKQRQEGKIPGILGRLGDLGAIDSKYDVAISTCCGRLDNIVVDTVKTAQQAIKYLKDYDIGRASFIALEKMFPAKPITTPENVPRLYDLVRVEDKRILPAMYFALRDTLVADDLNQATRIAYGQRRFRVVTLQGDVIEVSGTMAGGGKTSQKGRMGQSVQTKTIESPTKNRKNLDDMRRKAQEIRENIGYIHEQTGPLTKDIQNLKLQLAPHHTKIKKLKSEIEGLKERLPRLREQMVRQQQIAENVKIDPKKVKELQTLVAEKRTIYEKAEKNAKKVSSKVDEILNEIEDITQKKLKHYQIEIKKLTTEINKLETAIPKLNVEIKTSERNLKKCQDKIENLQTEIKEAEEKIRAESSERTVTEKEIEVLKEKVDEMKIKIDEAQAEFSDTKKEIVKIQKMEDDANLKRVEIEDKLKVVKKGVSDTKGQMPPWQNQLKGLKLAIIPRAKEPEEPLKEYTDEDLEKQKTKDLEYKTTVLQENLQTKPNLSVIEEYETKLQSYLDRVQVLEEITTKRNEMRQLYDDVRKKRYNEFMQGFLIISKRLKEIYQTITLGGDAELELVDSMDPFNEGIGFSVRPPKKSWKQISNLSGGEKTLSSLALVFALHYYKPSPLYVMDEIDAALDFKNVSIVAHYIKERARNAQFIIISLRSNMFELCEVLVGIFKVKDCSSSIAIENVPVDFVTQRLREQNNQRSTFDDILMRPSQQTTNSLTERVANLVGSNERENVEVTFDDDDPMDENDIENLVPI